MTSVGGVQEEGTLRDIIRTTWTSPSYTRKFAWAEDRSTKGTNTFETAERMY
jgi:hypothetical protein